jgi:glycosyltransferase involved in cell wall biosynthesis
VEILPLAAVVRDRNRFAAAPGPRAAVELATYILRLQRRLRQLAPDLVDANSLKSGVYGGVAAKLARKPLIWHVRDRLSGDYMSARNAFVLKLCVRLLSRAVICNSESTKGTLRWREAAPVVRSFARAAAPVSVSDEHLTVGMVGRLAPWKGQDLFLRAFAAAFPDGKGQAVIVGSALFGESDYAASLHDLARELDIADRVEFRGFVPDIAGQLAEFDVLVHASRSAEPFGQVVVEGMAAGVPVLAANCGGPAEIIDPGVTGLLFSANEVDELASALVLLRSDPDLRQRLGQAGKQRSMDFAPETAARPVAQVYRDCLSYKVVS